MKASQMIQASILTLLALASLGAQARYSGEDRGSPVMPAHVDAKWQTECSSCHVAYLPGLLPAASRKK